MENNKLMPISIIILSISIISGSILIGNSFKELANKNDYVNLQENDTFDDILELSDAANYLKITEGDLLYLVRENSVGIGYVEINGKYIFSREGLDKWLQTTRLNIQR